MNFSLWGLIAIVASGLCALMYIIACSTYWYSNTTEYDNGCVRQDQVFWSVAKVECSDECDGFAQTFFCGSSTNFVRQCDANGNQCNSKYRIRNLRATAALMSIATILMIVAFAIYLIIVIPVIRNALGFSGVLNGFKLGAAFAIAAAVFCLLALIVFGAGYPDAIRDDSNNNCGEVCDGLFGEDHPNNSPIDVIYWGGGAGFWIALVCFFVLNIPAIVFGMLFHLSDDGPSGAPKAKSAKVKTVSVWKCPECKKYTELHIDHCHNCNAPRPDNLED